VVVYLNDHRPAHVHIIGRGHEAVFNLRCPVGAVELRENYGFSRQEIRTIKKTLNAQLNLLCAEWEMIHG